MIERNLHNIILKKQDSGKAVILMGARQVGKTTLLRQLFGQDPDTLWLNGDDPDVQALFQQITSSRLRLIFGDKKRVIIDEAQRIPDVGLKLKLITDGIPDIQLLATGSSSFDLADKINEPLTGRKWEYCMYPLSFDEMVCHHGLLEEKRLLNHRMVYGYYPDIVTHPNDEEELLKLLTDSYLYKDILMWENIRKPDILLKLLQALAYQVGNQVSYNELCQLCRTDSKTMEKYILLLEKCYVIFRLPSFSRNLRNELKQSKKIYFYDNGIRNALIQDFRLLETRTDTGALWENFILAERMKYNAYNFHWNQCWFWRTKEQKEIDYLEEKNGQLSAYEFKWNPQAKAVVPSVFARAYPTATFKVIHPGNMEEFIIPERK